MSKKLAKGDLFRPAKPGDTNKRQRGCGPSDTSLKRLIDSLTPGGEIRRVFLHYGAYS